MTTTYQVKGSTIRSKFEYVGHHFGADARAALEATFEGRGLFPLLTASWYPYDLYVEVLDALTARHFGGDASRLHEVGAASAQGALSTVYQAFVRDQGFLEFLVGMSKLHHLFYNQGHIEVRIHPEEKGCDILHRDKPRYATSDLHVATGFYTRAAELHGLRQVTCSFERTDAGADFVLGWS